MTKVLVCQHVAHESLGTLGPLFKDHGIRVRYANFGRHPDLHTSVEKYDGLVILGGPMNVDQSDRYPHLLHELKLIEQALKQGIPILGICLGAQLIAKALGASVYDNAEKEIGWYNLNLTAAASEDSLFQHFRASERVFQWHGQTFDLPQGVTHLASSELCRHQAFRYDKQVYALQFHLEVDEKIINRWLSIECNQADLKMLAPKISPELIQQETPSQIVRLNQLSEQVFSHFSKNFGKQRRVLLPTSR